MISKKKRGSKNKASEQQIGFKSQDNFYRMMVNSLDEYGLFTTDREGNMNSWNIGAQKLFGYKEKEIIGKSFAMLFTREDQKKMVPKTKIREAKKLGKIFDERSHVHKNGSVFWASGLIYPLKDEKKIHQGFTVILTNRSEEKALNKRKDDFISTATHELKTPVASMRLFAEVVARQTKKTGDKIGLESVKELNVQLDRLTSLMNYLLDVAKIQQGKLELDKTSFNINAFIEEIIVVIKSISTEHIINFTKGANREVYADRERLKQVLTNLVSNAVKYSDKGNRVIVKSNQTKNNIVISVQDFGFGIPAPEQKLIFNRFYRANTALDRNISGIGLGLYVAMKIVEAHQGKMWVKSKEGKGSTFYFSIPIKGKKK